MRCKDLTIEAETVDGTRVSPDLANVVGRKATSWGSLIRLRTSVDDRIVQSAEGVR